LDKPIADRAIDNPLAKLSPLGGGGAYMGLTEILENIKKAKKDKNIKGIYLNLTELSAGVATLEEIRNALLDFKTSKKFIISYSESYSQSSYYLSSVADSIYIQPTGTIMHVGLSSQVMFFKDFLEKWGIKPVVIRHGKFKAAVEPFLDNKMSQANREQIVSYVGSIWNTLLKGISESRGIEVEQLGFLADSLKIINPQTAIEHKFIDKTLYQDQVMAGLRKLSGLKKDDKLRFVSLEDYTDGVSEDQEEEEDDKTKEYIAVIYASGEIITGEGDDETIGSTTLAAAIEKARKDKKVKAIVLRVNSPGGSALASDIIWREMVLAKKVKPVIASMGDVAASGGYYISCAADTIVASSSTITGSIGVFGLLFNIQQLVNEKIGIQTETVNTNTYSDAMSPLREMSEFERMTIQSEVESIYKVFISHVSEGRGMSKADVDSIGQGRVWSGQDALRIGLVDVIGGLDVAVKIAADKANLKKYKVKEYPVQKDFMQKLMEEFSVKMQNRIIENNFGEASIYYRHLNSMLKMEGVQARLPYNFVIK
jgi:protease-4